MANRIHPTAIIGDDVELGDDNVIGPYSVVVGPVRIGDGNWIGPHVTIGTPAEDRGGPHPVGWEGESEGRGVVIGDRNKIREYVTVHQGTHRASTVGDDCYLLVRSHVGHDVTLGDNVVLACSVQLGGHTEVWSHSNIGMSTVVHQHGRIGPGAMVGMGSAVRREVDAFTVSVGNPARVSGINVVGLSRRGCDEAAIEALEPFLKGKGDLPAHGVPEELSALLKAWADRAPLNH
ncbi:UDP-N-acetylglucosamine acyltransferase [Actinosynnema sp. NPDC051121]|nr:UDP-N-acetylglucosamine acyltransferase [Saccharothrix sp.]